MTSLSVYTALHKGAPGLTSRRQKTLIQLSPTSPRSRLRSVAKHPPSLKLLQGLGYTQHLVPASTTTLLSHESKRLRRTPLKPVLVSLGLGLQPPVKLKRATLPLNVAKYTRYTPPQLVPLLKPRYKLSDTVGSPNLSLLYSSHGTPLQCPLPVAHFTHTSSPAPHLN